MAQGGAASSKPVMPFYTLNLKTQEKVSALEEKWQVHFDWLTDVVAEAKVKYAKPGEERELSLLTQTPGPKRTRTARKNKASDSQNAQDQVETDPKSTKSRTTTATTSRSSSKAAQKSSLSALEENQNIENSELLTPDDRNEKSNSNVRDPAAELDHPIELRGENTNKSSSEKDNQVEDALLKTPILETTEENEEIAVKNQEISICPREDDTLELVLENTNELSETTTKQQEHGEHVILENETMDDRSIEIEEPVLDTDETDEAFKSKTVVINGSLVKTSEECKDKPESGNNETEHVEIVKKSFQSEDFVDDVFETTNEIETNKNNMDVQNDNLLHANKKPTNRLTNSVVSESTLVGKSIASISADNNSQLVSPIPATIANATFTVDDEIEFRREEAINIVNNTFVVESRQSVTSQVDDTVSEVNETVNIQSGEPGLSHNLVESNEIASPSEKIPSPLSITDTSSVSDEEDSIVDKEYSKIETNVNELFDDATHPETSIVKQKQSTCVPSQEGDNSMSSPAAGFPSPNVVAQDEDIRSFKSVGKPSKKASITSDAQDRSLTRSGKGEKVHPSVPSSSNDVSQQETSKVRETRNSRSSRNRSTKESVSQDGEEKSVRSTRSKQKQDKLEESSPAKTKENLSQPFEVSKKSDTTSRSRQPGDSHRSQSGSDNDEAPSTRNDRSGSILQQNCASRRSRRSSIASSLLKVSAARKHSVVELLQTMEGSLVTLVSADSPANASAVASKSNGTSQCRAKAGKVTKPKKAATRGVAPALRGVTPGSTYRGMTPGTMGSRTTPGSVVGGSRTTPGSVVGGSRTTPGSVVGGSRTTPGSVGGSRTTPGSVGSHNGGRVRSRLGIMEKANRGTPGKAASSQPNRSRHPSASEQMEEEKKMQEKAAEALKKKEELMKQKTDEQRNKREARIKRVQEARQAKEKEIRKKNEVKEAEEKLAAQAKRDKKLKEDAEKRRINEERQKVAEEKEEQAMIALAAELKSKEEALEAELRNREAAEQAKKIRDEEERRREREKKEEERRLLAEAKQREETIAREKEKLRKAQAEELKESINLNSTYTKPSSALDQSKNAGPSSYNMTPSRHAGNLPPEPLENENDYGLDDLDSEGSTDDEDQPRKEVPKWAEGGLLRTALLKQSYMGPDLDAIFASIEMPELADMFHHQRKRFFKRTSSAVWDTAPTSFKHGQR